MNDLKPNKPSILHKLINDRTTLEEVLLVPLLATLMALILGGLLMLATGEEAMTVMQAFGALFSGAFGSVYALSETLTAATPLVLAALGIALGFRAGLFNIGAEGQIIVGGLATAVVGFSLSGLPWIIHLPLALMAGALVGAAYASIAGWLRATTGAHEVITTIMLNLISFRLLDYFLRSPFIQKVGRSDPISKSVLESAELPQLLSSFDPLLRVHAGFLLMIAAVVFVQWLLFSTTIGFEFRATGTSPDAARYAGMRSKLIIVLVMAVAGALAGLAGASQVLGVLGRVSPGFSSGIGFDAIAVALLGRAHPVGVLFSGLLFGALVAGGRQMQVTAGVSIDLITIIQALIVVFIAAPALVRTVFPWAFARKRTGAEQE